MSEETKSEYEYQIPRNAKASFEMFGLTKKGAIAMLPFLGVAFVLFKVLSGPPSFVIPMVIAVLGYVGVTQKVDGETFLELAENYVRDLLSPQIHLWEETDHARFYQRTDRDWEEEQ